MNIDHVHNFETTLMTSISKVTTGVKKDFLQELFAPTANFTFRSKNRHSSKNTSDDFYTTITSLLRMKSAVNVKLDIEGQFLKPASIGGYSVSDFSCPCLSIQQ
jgi:hypothetical protein